MLMILLLYRTRETKQEYMSVGCRNCFHSHGASDKLCKETHTTQRDPPYKLPARSCGSTAARDLKNRAGKGEPYAMSLAARCSHGPEKPPRTAEWTVERVPGCRLQPGTRRIALERANRITCPWLLATARDPKTSREPPREP